MIIKILICRKEEDPSNEKKSEQKHESSQKDFCDVDNKPGKSKKDFDDKNSDEDYESKVMRFLRIKQLLENLFRNRRHYGQNKYATYLEREEVIIHSSA